MTVARPSKSDFNLTCDTIAPILNPQAKRGWTRQHLVAPSIAGQELKLCLLELGGLPAELLLTSDLYHIPHVHLSRHHGSNPWEKSGWVRSHATDQTPDLMVRQCEACQCLLSEKGMMNVGYGWSGVSKHPLSSWPIRQEVSSRINIWPKVAEAFGLNLGNEESLKWETFSPS